MVSSFLVAWINPKIMFCPGGLKKVLNENFLFKNIQEIPRLHPQDLVHLPSARLRSPIVIQILSYVLETVKDEAAALFLCNLLVYMH